MKKPESKLQDLVSRLQAASGDNLVSVVLYGSAAREEFHERYSDVNVLVVFRDLGAGPLSVITPVVRWWTHEEKFTPPLMMTEAELRESAPMCSQSGCWTFSTCTKHYSARILSAPSRFP